MKLTKDKCLCAGRWMGLWLIAVALVSVVSGQAVSTTTVQGTVYLANGRPGAGTLNVSWPAFTTANGLAVTAGHAMATIAPDGFMSVNLAPNLGATPAGLYYTAVYQMSDGTTSTEYWIVPAAAQASLGQVRAQVMPAAQAIQAVNKAYVDQAIAEVTVNSITATGGTMTGPLILSGDPTQPLQAADKHYVDATFAEAVPLAGGNMTGPLVTPSVNGVQAPATGSGQTTLQAAMSSAGTNGALEIPPNYTGTDGFTNPNGVYVQDLRQTASQQFERSVKEFGAVCDGATDDTNALQAAINYAQAQGVSLTIPQGTCKTRTLIWHGESIGGMGKQVSALMGFPGQDVLASATDSVNLLSYTRIHDLTIYVDQSVDVSCSAAEGRAPAGSCAVNRPLESNTVFSPGGNGLTGTAGTGAAWAVGNCAIAMPAATGAGGNGLRVAEIENLEIAATDVDPMAQYTGAHSTHTCGLYLGQWPQWSEFRNIDIRGLNTGIALPALPGTTPAGLNADSNRWQNITIQAAHGFTAAAGSNNVLDDVVLMAGNSAATGETPTGLVLDLGSGQQGWTVRNAMVLPAWNAVQPQLTVTASGGAVTAVAVGTEHGLGFDPYGTQVSLRFSGSCTAQAAASVNSNGSIGTVTVTQGGTGCSGTTTASVKVAGTWDTAAPVNLIGGQNATLFGGNLLKGNGGYTVWNATGSQSYGAQLAGGGGNLPGGGSYPALVENGTLGSSYQADQFQGADIGAKLQACLGSLSANGGTCDARNFSGTLSMGSNLTISTANATVLLPCATISTAKQVVVTAGTRNVALRGCALRGGSVASGSQGGTVFAYSGSGAMVQVGDPTYAADTLGFHMDNVAINTTAATSATATGLKAYRTQELDLESLYFLGNSNQTGMTLDGTGNYTGGTFLDNAFNGFQTAVNAIGHQVANAATTDWLNASAFVRLHIDCPMSGGNPISGTNGINLQQGDGNTFTGGDVEGCSTALHLGPNAQNNTIVGLRNENSTSQVVADAGSAYNSWITGGTMFMGALTDNGTRNSFLDTFHRSFNGLNGDWYGSQQDATITNHFRLGIGTGNERGLLSRYQTDSGYRWTIGLSDATGGEQFYQLLDELNSVYRLSIGQYSNGQSSTNNQTVINAAGTGAVVLNGSNNAGTGGVVFGSGGASESTVATISNAGNAQFSGTLQVGGTSTLIGTPTVKNQANAEIDAVLQAGSTASQKESVVYKDYNGSSQWYAEKDANNNWELNSATGGLDAFKAYQSTNSGDIYVNAAIPTGTVRVNYETGSGTAFNIYGGSSSTLYASFGGTTSIKFPGLAASSGHYCLQVDDSGYISNSGAACLTSAGAGVGTINNGNSGQIAYYASNGATVSGLTTVPVTAGGTGALTAGSALTNLGGVSTATTVNGHALTSNVTVSASDLTTGTLPHAQLPSLISGDIPNNTANTTGTAGNVTGTVAVANGGTGATSGAAALGNLGGVSLSGGTMTGPLTLDSDTPAGSQAASANAAVTTLSVLAYGANADLMPGPHTWNGYLAYTTSGSAALIVPTGSFAATDVGKWIKTVTWTTAPFSSTPYGAQIVSVTDGQHIVLNRTATASTTIGIQYGTDNVPAFNACATAAMSNPIAGGATCTIPAGAYLMASAPYYVLTGGRDDGSYGTPAGGSGATISTTVSGGVITGYTVTAGGSGYTPDSTLVVNYSGGGGGGYAYATASTNSSGQVVSVTPVYAGELYTSAPTATVSPVGGDGAAATATVSGGSINGTTITAAGGGYGSGSTVPVYGIGGAGCTQVGGYGNGVVPYTAAGTATANTSGQIVSITFSNAGSGCTAAPRLIFGSNACNTGTLANPVWSQCSNLAPLVPLAAPVQVLLYPGVNWQGAASGDSGGTFLMSVWDGSTVDSNEPAIFGGSIAYEDIKDITFEGFLDILAVNNVNYSNVQDDTFYGGIGMFTQATDVNSRFEGLTFGSYATWINGGTWWTRRDTNDIGGGFFSASLANEITSQPVGYDSISAAIDNWFASNFWHPEFSAHSPDFPGTCTFPQTANQRQTSVVVGGYSGGNTMCYPGITATGMEILTRGGIPTGGTTMNNFTVKSASRNIFYGSLGGAVAVDWGCESCGGISSDPYRSASVIPGAVEITEGGGSFNVLGWSAGTVNRCIWSITNQGNPTNTAWNGLGCGETQVSQPSQNPNFQNNIDFPSGLTVDAGGSNNVAGLDFYGLTSSYARIFEGDFQGWFGSGATGISFIEANGSTDMADLLSTGIVSHVPFSAPSFTLNGGTQMTGSAGTGGYAQETTGATKTSGNPVAFDANGNTVNATAANIAALLSSLTGCSTAGYFYVPGSGNCQAQGASMAWPSGGAGIPNYTGSSSWGTSYSASSPIPASLGGTGEAGTVTGILYGNGTAAHTAATAANIATLLSSLAGCSLTGYFYSPASGSCSTLSGGGNVTAASLMVNAIPVASSSTGITNSSITDNGTTVSTSEPISAGSFNASGLPAGCAQYPCVVAKVAPTLYSGTASLPIGGGYTTLYAAPSGGAGLYRLCWWLSVTAAATAGNVEILGTTTADGHANGWSSGFIAATGVNNAASGCSSSAYVDAGSNVQWWLWANGVTGTPTFRYAATLERLQ